MSHVLSSRARLVLLGWLGGGSGPDDVVTGITMGTETRRKRDPSGVFLFAWDICFIKLGGIFVVCVLKVQILNGHKQFLMLKVKCDVTTIFVFICDVTTLCREYRSHSTFIRKLFVVIMESKGDDTKGDDTKGGTKPVTRSSCYLEAFYQLKHGFVIQLLEVVDGLPSSIKVIPHSTAKKELKIPVGGFIYKLEDIPLGASQVYVPVRISEKKGRIKTDHYIRCIKCGYARPDHGYCQGSYNHGTTRLGGSIDGIPLILYKFRCNKCGGPKKKVETDDYNDDEDPYYVFDYTKIKK